MASNVVIDGTTISSIQSQIATTQQYLNTGQYYYKGRDYASASVYPFLHTGTIQAMSVFQTTVPISITSSKVPLELVVPPNSFRNKPIVTATVECAGAPGPMVAVLTSMDTVQYSMNFDIYTITSGAITNPITAYVHITAIGPE
jgi:hypothetical protein